MHLTRIQRRRGKVEGTAGYSARQQSYLQGITIYQMKLIRPGKSYVHNQKSRIQCEYIPSYVQSCVYEVCITLRCAALSGLLKAFRSDWIGN